MEDLDPKLYRLGGYLDCLDAFHLSLAEKMQEAYDYGVNVLRLDPKTVITHIANEYSLFLDTVIEFFGAEDEFD